MDSEYLVTSTSYSNHEYRVTKLQIPYSTRRINYRLGRLYDSDSCHLSKYPDGGLNLIIVFRSGDSKCISFIARQFLFSGDVRHSHFLRIKTNPALNARDVTCVATPEIKIEDDQVTIESIIQKRGLFGEAEKYRAAFEIKDFKGNKAVNMVRV